MIQPTNDILVSIPTIAVLEVILFEIMQLSNKKLSLTPPIKRELILEKLSVKYDFVTTILLREKKLDKKLL